MKTELRYHSDIFFTHPDGIKDMAQTLLYKHRDECEANANEIKDNMLRVGCTDISIHTRETYVVIKSA